jgi:hypothetical protein
MIYEDSDFLVLHQFVAHFLQGDFWDACLPTIASRTLYSLRANWVDTEPWIHQENIVFP